VVHLVLGASMPTKACFNPGRNRGRQRPKESLPCWRRSGAILVPCVFRGGNPRFGFPIEQHVNLIAIIN
jgi:hypothetical protein